MLGLLEYEKVSFVHNDSFELRELRKPHSEPAMTTSRELSGGV